jgi:hypothetical protein
LTITIQEFDRTTDFYGIANSFKLIVGRNACMQDFLNVPLTTVVPEDFCGDDNSVRIYENLYTDIAFIHAALPPQRAFMT